MADPVGEDVEMMDSAEDSRPSVFALLQPKRERVASLASKGKFVPKLKARPEARVRTQPSGSSQVETKGDTPVNDELAIPSVRGDIGGASASIDRKAANAAGSIPLLTSKAETNVIKLEPMDDGPLLKVKAEPQDDARSEMHLDADLSEKSIKDEAKEPSFKEEVVAMNDDPMLKEPLESTPGVDRVVREIDVFLTPEVDSETKVRCGFMLLGLISTIFSTSWSC